MKVRVATTEDLSLLMEYDKHIGIQKLNNLIYLNRVYLVEEQGQFLGWYRYNLFWDSIPFLNMLYLLEPYRGKGIGRNVMADWEGRMKALGCQSVMTSTASDEYAQHFYRKLGYQVIGGFLPEGDPYEMILSKKI